MKCNVMSVTRASSSRIERLYGKLQDNKGRRDMILRPKDTQEVPGVGVFEWDGREYWVLGEIKRTHGELYVILRDIGQDFNIKSGG